MEFQTNDESLLAWETNADFWDSKMGDDSNEFHREIVRPKTELLLDIQPKEYVLDIACGNGNFSKRLAEQGAQVVAFDYSPRMIKNAKKRQAGYLESIDFQVCDGTNYNQVLALSKNRVFDKAVANMAIMDISDIAPLFRAVYSLLKDNGIFVFSTHHPCFIRPDGDYKKYLMHKGEAIAGQPMLHNYYHRSLQELFMCCFSSGFVIDGFYEEALQNADTPIIIFTRLRKPNKAENGQAG